MADLDKSLDAVIAERDASRPKKAPKAVRREMGDHDAGAAPRDLVVPARR
jgi:hypothetical protein